eukprot:2918291-Rhodomonas_salina.6
MKLTDQVGHEQCRTQHRERVGLHWTRRSERVGGYKLILDNQLEPRPAGVNLPVEVAGVLLCRISFTNAIVSNGTGSRSAKNDQTESVKGS